MATSGVTSFTTTRDQIIRSAALEVSAIGLGVTMSAEMLQDFALTMNAMIKHWQGKGLKIWSVREGTLFPAAGQTRYSAGAGATDHITDTYVPTYLSADAAAGDVLLRVDATTSVTVGDHLGVIMDTGYMHWTTVVSKLVSSVTVADALTVRASEGSAVFTYTNRIPKPIRVVDARRHTIISDISSPVEILSHQEYRALPNKASTGSISHIQYDPQRLVGYFNIWSVPATLTELLKFTWWAPLEIFSTGGNNPDFPEEWINCLKWNLAKEMMGRYPVNPQRRADIRDNAAATLIDMEGFSREDTSIFLQPNVRRR